MGLFDYNESNTENISKTEDTVINSLYQLMEKNIEQNVSNKITFKTKQTNTGNIIANGIGSEVTNLTEDQKNDLDVKTNLYMNLSQYIDESAENDMSLSSAMTQLKQQIAEAIQEDDNWFNLANVQTSDTTNDDETYYKTIQSSVDEYLTNVANRIANDESLDLSQDNAQNVIATNGGKITNACIDQFNQEETTFENEIRSAYEQYTDSVNKQQTQDIKTTSDQQGSSTTTESEGNQTLMIIIIIACVVVAVIIIVVVCVCVKNPEGVKAVGETATSVATSVTPAGAAANAAAVVLGGLKQISRTAAIAIVCVLCVIIVVGLVLVIDGSVNYVINDQLLTEMARNWYVISKNKLYQQDPSKYSSYTSDQIHQAFEEEYNTGNIVEMAIGSFLTVGAVIAVCVCGDLWKKQGLLG